MATFEELLNKPLEEMDIEELEALAEKMKLESLVDIEDKVRKAMKKKKPKPQKQEQAAELVNKLIGEGLAK